MSTNKNKKNRNVFIATIILIVLGSFAYAYFQAQLGIGTSSEITVNPKTTDNLKFATCGDAIITLTQFNFTEGGNNNSSSTCAKAKLKANNDTNSATQTYNVYVFINKNNFIYTTNNNTPEIIMSVTDPLGNPVTTITGLTYTTSGGVSGFDVTTQKGLFQIASDYTISTTTTKIDTWNITFTAINLDTNQSANSGHSFKAQAIIKADEYKFEVAYDNCPNPEITNDYFLMCDDSLLACKVAKDFDYENINDSKVVLHNGIVLDETDNCAILDAEDDSYRYTGGDYDVTQKAINEGYNYVTTYSGNLTEGVIGLKCSGTDYYVGIESSYCAPANRYYYLLYDSNETSYSNYDDALSQAISDEYVVSRELNNYVCFGYNKSISANNSICPAQNLYRIIGAFDDDQDGNYELKLIKVDLGTVEELGSNSVGYVNRSLANLTGYKGNLTTAPTYYWSGGSGNRTTDWTLSTLKSTNFDVNFVNYLTTNGGDINIYWTNFIKTYNWYYGISSSYPNSKIVYNNERNSSTTSNFGIMNLSDYGYGIFINKWNKDLHDPYFSSISENWLYSGTMEWTLTPQKNNSKAYNIVDTGFANSGYYVYNASFVRPTFYLKPNITIEKGNGSKTNPYYISLSS